MTNENKAIRNVLGRAIGNIPTAIAVEDEDYSVDGILHCGKCGTAKQVEISIGNGEVIRPFCLCKCQQEQMDKLEKIEAENQRNKRIAHMRNECFPQGDLESWNFENDDLANEHVSSVAKNYVEHFDAMKERGKGLIFFGSVGTGKTYYAACIANALIDSGIPCLVTNFSRLVNTIHGMYSGKQNYIDSLNNYQLLVIDDLAAERDTEFMNEIVYSVIDSRYRAGLPTIFTTNLTSEELYFPAEIHRQRIFSRVLEMTIPVKVEGSDRRKQKLKDSMGDLNELLGL